jgi:hypothetical protein
MVDDVILMLLFPDRKYDVISSDTDVALPPAIVDPIFSFVYSELVI